MGIFGNLELENMIIRVLLILSAIFIVGMMVYIGLDQRAQEPGDTNNVSAGSSDVRLYDVVFQSRSGGAIQWEMNADVLEQDERATYVKVGRIHSWQFFEDDKTVMDVAAAGARVLKRTQDVELEGPIEVFLWLETHKGRESGE